MSTEEMWAGIKELDPQAEIKPIGFGQWYLHLPGTVCKDWTGTMVNLLPPQAESRAAAIAAMWNRLLQQPALYRDHGDATSPAAVRYEPVQVKSSI
jgi:hypothetical protein